MIGTRLKLARTKAGHTQESLAELMETNGRQIWRWENGENEPSGQIVARLAQELNVTTDYLLGLTDDPTPSDKRVEGLTYREQRIINALRNEDYREAIKAIVNDE